ncbi:MAG: choice-of-anchor Q domain-containing protein [Bacteroidales bacterium]
MKNFLLTFLMLITNHLSATNYYVSPTGSNNNNGLSADKPFKTLQHAADLTVPGDTVFAMTGTYTNLNTGDNVLNINNSGTANSWIVYKNHPGNTPVIQLYDQWAGIQVQGADYIVIDGFVVIGNNDSITPDYAQSQKNNINNPATSGNGIGCAPEYGNSSNKPHHIIIRNCTVSKCGGGGIYSVQGDYLRIENNIVSECAWYSPYGNSGISLYQNWNSDSSTGIKNYVMGNTCYRNEEYIPVSTAGIITDGNGIIIDDSRNTQGGSMLGAYIGKTYIANNLVFNNGGRGIHCYSSDKVIVVNNTCFQNCQSPSVQDGEFTAYDTDSVSFINNISFPAYDIRPMNESSTSTYLTVDHNLWAANSGLANPFGTNTVTNSPDFVLPSDNPSFANFHLRPGSAAINAGTHFYAPATDKDGNNRSATDSVDIGCYEFNNSEGIINISPSENRFLIYPDPASGIISLVLDNQGINQIEVSFYNMAGEKIKTINTICSDGYATVAILELKPGIYFIAVKTNKNQIASGRFLKI